MRKFLKKLIEILDGTPAVYGKKQRGQSVLELALVSPLLVILLAGLVEIGWFARNYMILLEVTRVGARTGTVQQNETSPLAWNEEGSVFPSDANETQNFINKYRNCNVNDEFVEIGFYNFIACVMLRSLDPLPFGSKDRVEQGSSDPGDFIPDDIVISAFAVQAVDPTDPIWSNNGGGSTIRRDSVNWPLTLSGSPPQAIVVGRWPTTANECHYQQDGSPFPGDAAGPGKDGRDPFDWIRDGQRTIHPTHRNLPLDQREDRYFLEVHEPDNVRERYRGFNWLGQHAIVGTGCYGSEWDITEVEDLINLQGFNLTPTQRRYVPSQGIVLVEMWWQHESLSQFVGLAPVISPVFAILGTDTVVQVWAAFPLPQVEPRIQFDQ